MSVDAVNGPSKTQYSTETTKGSLASLDPLATPDADRFSAADLDDALAALYALVEAAGEAHDKVSAEQVNDKKTSKKEALKQQLAKIEEDIKAEKSLGLFDSIFHAIGQLFEDFFKGEIGKMFEDLGKNIENMINSPNLWKDLQKVATFVAEVAAAVASVASFGSASGLMVGVTAASIALCMAGAVEQNFHVMEQLTHDPAFAKVFGLALSITGALLGGAAGLCQAGKEALTDTARAAGALEGGSKIVSGAAGAGVSAHEYVAAMRQTDIERLHQRQDFLKRCIDSIISDLQEYRKKSAKDEQTVQKTIETSHETQLIAASMLRA